MSLQFELKKISFGGYSGDPANMFEDASKWIKDNPKIAVSHAILYSDEGCYLDIVYEELKDKGIQHSLRGSSRQVLYQIE